MFNNKGICHEQKTTQKQDGSPAGTGGYRAKTQEGKRLGI